MRQNEKENYFPPEVLVFEVKMEGNILQVSRLDYDEEFNL